MSIIVVEGVDGSGKSTLIKQAREQIKKRYFTIVSHSCRPLHIDDAEWFLTMVEDAQLSVVVDRHPLISEPIYGPILRNSNLVSHYTPNRIEHHLKRTVDRIIYCRPLEDRIRLNLDANPQLAGVQERLSELLLAYDDRMIQLANVGIPVFYYNYTESSQPLEEIFFGSWPAEEIR